MEITVRTMSITIKEPELCNGSNAVKGKKYYGEISIEVKPDDIEHIFDLAKNEVAKKYPDQSCRPTNIYFSRRVGENYLTASVKCCIGDGDYVSRLVEVDLPELLFGRG